ncbi:MAG: DNA double-strand break repair nuclease NurA [Chloroflexi bacterium]|nr:DNA double-strand break repair nuclease NurA [Chloroflexota bacterium]
MALDLTRTALQLDSMAVDIKEREVDRRARLQNALAALKSFDVEEYQSRRETHESALNYPIAAITSPPDAAYEPPPLPSDFSVASADGSHIDVDRHSLAQCYLINIGTVVLTYGSKPDARLQAQPKLYARDEDMVLRDEGNDRAEQVEGAVLGAKRAVEEVAALAEVVEGLPQDRPVVAMVDGSLAFIGLRRGVHQDLVFRSILEDGFVMALRRMEAITGKVAVMGYISLPNSAEVVGALRLASCGLGVLESKKCGGPESGRQACDACVGGVRDRDVFGALLQPGQRSEVFGVSSDVVTQYYGDQSVRFFYLNAGSEIVRVEVPQWVAEDTDILGLVHTVTLDQCRRNTGYPAALMEAHEQAVISGGDRRLFSEMLTDVLEGQGVAANLSEKDRSKRMRWL